MRLLWQMPAISMDKHDCLFSIVTMFELKNLPRAPYSGQTLDEAVPVHPQPPSFLPCNPFSVGKTPLLLLSDNWGKTLSGWADKIHLLRLIVEAVTMIEADFPCQCSVFISLWALGSIVLIMAPFPTVAAVSLSFAQCLPCSCIFIHRHTALFTPKCCSTFPVHW